MNCMNCTQNRGVICNTLPIVKLRFPTNDTSSKDIQYVQMIQELNNNEVLK